MAVVGRSSIIIYENIDLDKLIRLKDEGDINIQELANINNLIKKVKKTGYNTVEYKYKTRITASTPSVQYLSNNCRSYLYSEDYIDLDMQSCALNIIKSLVYKYELNDFYDLTNKLFDIKKNINDKVKINSFLFGQATLDELSKEEAYMFKKLREQLVDYHKEISKKIKNVSIYQFYGTALSHIIYHYEHLCISNAIDFFDMNNIEYSTIVFDGICVKNITQEQIELMEEYIYENIEIKTKWIIKPWIDIPDTFFKEKSETKSNYSNESNDTDDIINIVFCDFINWANENKYIRLYDTTIILQVQEQKYNALNVFDKANDIINAFNTYCRKQGWKTYGNPDKNTEKIEKALISFLKNDRPNELFPIIKRDKRYFGYKNGVFDLYENKFIVGDDIPDDMIVRKYFDEDFKPINEVPEEILTIFNYQEFTKETQDNILYMLGRSYFPINKFDKIGMVLNNVGASSVGKSTLIDSIGSTMDKSNIVVCGTSRSAFGLEGKNNKELLKVHEAERLMKGLEEDDFKSMCRGEEVEIECKGVGKYTETWNTPILLASQNPLIIQDKSGAINKKRIMNVKYTKMVDKEDVGLGSRLNNKMPNFIPYLINHYHTYKFELSEQIKCWNDEISEENNYFEEWISSMNQNVYQQVIYKEGIECKPAELLNAWSKHWKFTLQNTREEPPKIGIHENALLAKLGIQKKQSKYCMFCEQRHLKGCCDKYDRNKKKTLTTYLNCDIITGGLHPDNKRYAGE